MLQPAFLICLTSVTLSLVLGNCAAGTERSTLIATERDLIAASGVPPEAVELTLASLERLAGEFRAEHNASGDLRAQAESIHKFLHERVLTGTFRADASNLASTLDGKAFNCAAATALFLALAERTGLNVCAVSAPGHVWCRVSDGRQTLDIETTCRDWFAVADRYHGVSDELVSAAMATHRRRVQTGRVLTPREFLAIFHFNRGVTFLRHNQFDSAIEANLQALALDPRCRPANENFTAVVRHLFSRPQATAQTRSRLFLQLFGEAWSAYLLARSAS